MPDRTFLEQYPLYKKFKMKVPDISLDLAKPSIRMHCPTCTSNQTFVMFNAYSSYRNGEPTYGKTYLIEYKCAGCSDFIRLFLIKVSEKLDYIYKAGQYPAWDISIDKNLEKILDKHAELFKNGLVCESQNYGIGAYAYYRRIVELIIDELLKSIYDIVEEKEKAKYEEALKKVAATRNTQEKINLVKDLLPSILRPAGMNPLAVLYENLSEGLHEKSDNECMEIAEKIKSVLVFMVDQVIRTQVSAKEFTESMRTMLDKKSKSAA